MTRQVVINFATKTVSDNCLGYINEHNATELIIYPPEELKEDSRTTGYYIAFQSGSGVVLSENFPKQDVLNVLLWNQLTQKNKFSIQLVATDDNGDYVGKSETISGLFFKESIKASDTKIEYRTDLIDKIQIAFALKHSHNNKEVIDEISEDDGVLLFKGRKVGSVTEWNDILNKPNSIAGYRIEDVYTKIEVDQEFIKQNEKIEEVQNAITTEENNRIESDNQIIERLESESEMRQAAEQEINQKLEEEQGAREQQYEELTNRDSEISEMVSQEITNRVESESQIMDIVNDKASSSDVYTKEESDDALSGKVDKIDGKGLSSNDFTTEEKTKLAGLENYDDTELKQSVTELENNKQDVINFDNKLPYDYLSNTPDIPTEVSDLINDVGYQTASDVQAAVENKQDKEEGKGLSSNDYTTEEKNKLAGLENYDDTAIKADITALQNAGYQTASDVQAAISGKQDKPSDVTETAPTAITLTDNTEYYLTEVSDLTLTYPSGRFEVWITLTTVSSGTITITLPTSQYIGTVPTFGNGEIWEVSIKNGVVVAGKVS